ncbi:hypothetical protein [Bartonella bovis]|nr:hypothetical protein [Bartonella bovis]
MGLVGVGCEVVVGEKECVVRDEFWRGMSLGGMPMGKGLGEDDDGR